MPSIAGAPSVSEGTSTHAPAAFPSATSLPRDTMPLMVWVDVIEPGLGEIWNAGRLMLASKTGWAKARRNGCEYVLERGDERVYALRSGFMAYAGGREDWGDPILDIYGEGWRERRDVAVASEETYCAVICGIILDRIGVHPRSVPVGRNADANDIDRFDRLNERWIGVIENLLVLCDGQCRIGALEQARNDYETCRARLVSAHQKANRRVLYRLQVLGGILAASGVGQFVLALGDPSVAAGWRILSFLASICAGIIVYFAVREYRE